MVAVFFVSSCNLLDFDSGGLSTTGIQDGDIVPPVTYQEVTAYPTATMVPPEDRIDPTPAPGTKITATLTAMPPREPNWICDTERYLVNPQETDENEWQYSWGTRPGEELDQVLDRLGVGGVAMEDLIIKSSYNTVQFISLKKASDLTQDEKDLWVNEVVCVCAIGECYD